MEDPSSSNFLEGLSPEERAQALEAAAIAKRAEERAEQRELERAMKEREAKRRKEKQQEEERQQFELLSKKSKRNGTDTMKNGGIVNSNNNTAVVFVPKRKRGRHEQQEQQEKQDEKDKKEHENGKHSALGKINENKKSLSKWSSSKVARQQQRNHNHHGHHGEHAQNDRKHKLWNNWTSKDLEAVKESYLGKNTMEAEHEKAEKRKKQRTNKKITFRFKWDDTDDTFNGDDPLYSSIHPTTRYNNNNSYTGRRGGGRMNHHFYHGPNRNSNNRRDNNDHNIIGGHHFNDDSITTVDSVYTKSLAKMTSRDWRIFRENYEIVVKGGKAPPPLRHFHETPLPDEIPNLHPQILDALQNVMHFKEPTPIQRQAIPIGLCRRDLIGIAETGSGKTVAFGVPLCNYILNLSSQILSSVAEEGPLALVMAPTRELALQINDEFTKLLKKQSNIKNCCIVGGQQIQHQAYQLRKGVHIVVGTPGRINECLEMAYLVLNQCYYVVLDEADRMIDMGFQPQIESIMDSMAGILKSEKETETYQQEKEDLRLLLESSKQNRKDSFGGTCQLPKHRVTSMFSATMPLEVERIAKRYLRHPAVISIGDQDSSKNARIEQRILFLSSPGQKENALREILQKSSSNRNNRDHYNRGDHREYNNNNNNRRDEKIIVFVNEKKHADVLGRIIEGRIGRSCVVLHGGKSQEQREESLAAFRRGGVIMVATDVAGRGLDIPDVSQVVNYDLPTRSIENYCHRIGRTGRAGKLGLATSFLTEEDTGIMAPLKAYLESTNQNVPSRLANHPAAKTNVEGNLIH